MATEVQMLNQAVDTAFAEEEAKDVEEARDDWKLNALEDLEGLLGGGLLMKEGTEMVADMLDTRSEAEQAADLKIKTQAIIDSLGSAGDDEVADDPNFKNPDDIAKAASVEIDPDDNTGPAGKKVDTESVQTSDYINGTNLKSMDINGQVSSKPWVQGLSAVAKIAFGWGENRRK